MFSQDTLSLANKTTTNKQKNNTSTTINSMLAASTKKAKARNLMTPLNVSFNTTLITSL